MAAASLAGTPLEGHVIETRLFIDNEFVNSATGKTFPCTNPATEEHIADIQEATKEDVDLAVAAAKRAWKRGSVWRKTNASSRRDLMIKLADLIERDKGILAALEGLDNGKPSQNANAYGTAVDVYLGMQNMRYFAGWADKCEGKTVPVDGDLLNMTFHEPVGIVGAIIPWNFPFLMAMWKLGPILATGCVCVIKTSEKTPLSALHLAKLVKEAGFPAGVVNILSGFGPTAGEPLARHMDVRKIAFTGSTAIGRHIQKCAAESNLKNVTLELGGKSPLIVCEDADLDEAARIAHTGLFLNMGQCCCASSRLYVQESIYDAFVAKVTEIAKQAKVGGTFEADSSHGPLVDDIQFKRVCGFIASGQAEGATLHLGGGRVGAKGYFVQPTIFTNVTDDMVIAREEIFGPVMSCLKWSTLDEVIDRANDTEYGLAAGVVTKNISKAIYLAKSLEAGTVWVNCYNSFDAANAFGGYKQSGIGREMGEYALRNFMETKSVTIPFGPC